jgi:hypothetical protein
VEAIITKFISSAARVFREYFDGIQEPVERNAGPVERALQFASGAVFLAALSASMGTFGTQFAHVEALSIANTAAIQFGRTFVVATWLTLTRLLMFQYRLVGPIMWVIIACSAYLMLIHAGVTSVEEMVSSEVAKADRVWETEYADLLDRMEVLEKQFEKLDEETTQIEKAIPEIESDR